MKLSHFKKIHEDEKVAVLKNHKGHEIKISKQGLSNKLLKDLQRLPLHAAEGAVAPSIPVATDPSQVTEGLANVSGRIDEFKNKAPDDLTNKIDYDKIEKENTPYLMGHDQPRESPRNVQLPGSEESQKGALPAQEDAGLKDLNRSVANLQTLKSNYEKKLNQLYGEYDTVFKDAVKDHINPNEHLQSMGTGQKVATAIGLILGGMGSGLTGGENPALKFLNDQIDRNIEAQKNNIGNKNNLLGAASKMTGNITDAVNVARALDMSLMAARLMKAGYASNDPVRQQRALQAKGFFDSKARQLLGAVATRSSVSDTANEMDQIKGRVPDKQQRMVVEQLQNVKSSEKIKKEVTEAFRKARDESRLVKRIGRAGTPAPALAELRNLMMPIIRKAAGKVSDIELKKAEQLEPSFFDNAKDAEDRLDAILRMVEAGAPTSTLEDYGINVKKPAPKGTPISTRKR